MTPEEQAVKDAADAAAAAASNVPTELEKQLAEKDELISKLTTDRDNYKKGMLKAKGKVKDENGVVIEETEEEKFDRMFNEKMLDSELAKANKEKDDIIKNSLIRIRELETAVKNRTGIVTTGGGSGNETKLTPKDPILSDEKLKQLKAMGWDDKKIELFKKNLMRNK